MEPACGGAGACLCVYVEGGGGDGKRIQQDWGHSKVGG
jgi:hypothetical protein